MNIKIYENYGVLGAEKRRVYTFGGPHARAVTADEMLVEIPSGWEYWENDAGCGMVTAPWGTTYDVNEVLCGDEFPHFYALDNDGKPRKTMLRIIKCAQ